MQEVLENLKSNQLLHSQNVLEIKACISKRYPDYSKKHSAVLFAAAIHKIIDKHLCLFDKSIQSDLKISLLQEAVKKDVFAINAYDIFSACIALDLSEEQYIENLTDWINTYQDKPLLKDELFQLALQLKNRGIVLAAGIALHSELHDEALALTIPSAYEELALTVPVAYDQPSRFNTLKHAMTTLLNLIKSHNRVALATTIMTLVVFIFLINSYENYKAKALIDAPRHITSTTREPLAPAHLPYIESASDHPLPRYLQYKDIDTEALITWLDGRDSILSEEPYFSGIIAVAKEYDINPLLMFAITGQEQAFVPRSSVHAASMANNPFNVFGSWEDFNTDITDTSKIAARTLLNLGKDRPENMDAVQWINRKYAEDSNWHRGVSQIFAALEKVAGNE